MADQFTVERFLGCGCYSFVYSVTSKQSVDEGTSYAMKRFFPSSATALRNALKEVNILSKMTSHPRYSPFIPSLYYAFVIHNSPILVITEALGITLDHLLRANNAFTLEEAKFYLCEMIAGLAYLHSFHIVHLEFKVDNILLSKSGHIMISDFDRSVDLSVALGRVPPADFNVNLYYSAPEIASEMVITCKADVWSLGVVTAYMLGRYIRPRKLSAEESRVLAKAGTWNIAGFQTLPKCWREFFNQVFIVNHQYRASLGKLQSLALFQEVDWRQVEELRLTPPFSVEKLVEIKSQVKTHFDPKDEELLNCLFSYCMPKVHLSVMESKKNEDGTSSFIIVPPEYRRVTMEQLENVEANCRFVHPFIYYRRILAV